MLDPSVFLQNPTPDFKFPMNQLCKVCGEPAAGFHFGAFTCEGCKSFFGRTYNNVSGIAECKNGGRCEINKKNRTSCKSCRLRKCLQVGMSKSGSRYGRRSNWFKIHCLLQAQGHTNGMGHSPEANNNSSSVANNNSPNSYQSSLGKSQLPSTITSFGSMGNNNNHCSDERERDRDRDRERTPSSSASRNGTNGIPSGFTSLSSLSPESLSSLNRKLASSDLADYFRAAGMGSSGMKPGSGKSLYSEDDRGEDMSRTTRSPGSLESPRSEASGDEGKSNTPLFAMPPGSPLEVKPNDLLSFDLITRDLMKMGYDPLRLWPAMFSAQPNIHQFNPYRFIFPNFPGAAAAAFPGGFPPNPNAVPPPLLNGGLHPAKLFSAASLVEGMPSPLANLPSNLSSANLHNSQSHSPNNRASPPNHTSIRSRVTPVVPPSSSLTLTPPISHHGSDEPALFPLKKLRNVPIQELPIDLSAKSTNNNHVDDLYSRPKKFPRLNGDISDMDDEPACDNDSENYNSEDIEMKDEMKSDYGDSDRDDDEVEDLSNVNNNNNIMKSVSRRSSCGSRSPSTERVGTPLDLTRSSSTNSSPPIPKIAT